MEPLRFGSTGVDEVSCLTLTYPDNVFAQLTGSMCINKPQEAFVVGEKGFIKVHAPFYCPSELTLHRNGTNQPTRQPFRMTVMAIRTRLPKFTGV